MMYHPDKVFQLLPEVEKYVLSKIKNSDFVVDIGPGPTPLERANLCCDLVQWVDQKPYQIINFLYDELPKADFYFCRHVLEDLRYPENILQQLQERGYIETPSPAQECLVGVYQNIPVNGHIHHYWITWTEQDVLYFLPKYPIIMRTSFDPRAILLNLAYWNNYYFFENGVKYKIFESGTDFELGGGFKKYFELLEWGINAANRNTKRIVSEF